MAEAAPSQMTGGAADWLAWLTDPKAPMPSVPSVPNVQPLPPRIPPASPEAAVARPMPAVAQTAVPPRIPTPGASPEAQNTSNVIDSVFNMLRGSGGNPNASHSIVNNAAFGTPPASGSPSATIINNAAAATPPSAPTGATPMMLRGPLSGQQAMGGTPPPVPAPSPATPAVPSPSQQQPGVPPAPGPPPSVPEDNSDNVAMGTGPGRAVSHDQAAALSGAATNLGTKVAQDPSTVSSILKDLSSKGLADNDENAWLALANAGFATMASRSPFVGQAIGEGAQAGLQSYQQSRAARAQQLNQVVGRAQTQQGLEQQGAYQKGVLSSEQQKNMLADTKFQSDLAMAQKTLPYDLALKQAQAQYYQDHGIYMIDRGNAATTGGGGTGYRAKAFGTFYDAALASNGGDKAAATATALQQLNQNATTPHERAFNKAFAYFQTSPSSAGLTLDEQTKEAEDYATLHEGDPEFARGSGGAPQQTAAAAPALPKGALGVATGQTDGKTANKGALVARGGYWYPAT